jgi:hypothetical protein
MELIINSWKHSVDKSELSKEQLSSTIMLLEKKENSTEQLNSAGQLHYQIAT